MSSVLVLGGAGFIGSSLIRRLVQHNFKVISLDNYSSGSVDNHIDGATYLNGNVNQVNNLVTDDIDIVFHFGEYSRVEPSFKKQDLVFESNLNSIYSVLKFCQTNSAKLIYAGSSSGFAAYEQHQVSPYTFIKKINVDIINQFSLWNSIDYAIVYFYNAYGEGEIGSGEYSTVVERFIQMKISGDEFAEVHGTGEQTRNFTYIQDIINALIIVVAKGNGDGYGIGCDKSWSINNLCSMVGLKPKYVGDVKGNRYFAPLNTKKTKDLGWNWEKSLEDYVSDRLKRES